MGCNYLSLSLYQLSTQRSWYLGPSNCTETGCGPKILIHVGVTLRMGTFYSAIVINQVDLVINHKQNYTENGHKHNINVKTGSNPRWRHNMETLSALPEALLLYGNPPGFGVFFIVNLNRLQNRKYLFRRFDTSRCSCSVICVTNVPFY